MDKIITDSKGRFSLENVGGKCYNLIKLKKFGFKVPEFVGISACELINNDVIELIKTSLNCLDCPVDKIEKFREKVIVTETSKRIIEKYYKKISKNSKYKVAIRSSAKFEDGINQSFAGAMDTILNVKSSEEAVKSVVQCLGSVFNERIITYRKKNDLPVFGGFPSIIIQRMVDAEASGVMFTKDIINKKKNQIYISAVLGLGEGLVSGLLDADSFVINKLNGEIIEQNIVSKKEMLIGGENGTVRVKSPPEQAETTSLSNHILKKLYKNGLNIEKKFGVCSDIEFAVADNKLYILQTRPITTDISKNNIRVWDNSNIVESYSGVTTPLTYTFIRKAYSGVYSLFCGLLGVDKQALTDDPDLFNNMLGLIEGRVYYNLINWYKIVSYLPGYKYNKAFMEQMMGVSTVSDLVDTDSAPGFFRKYFVYLPQTAVVGFKMLYILLTLDKRIEKFFKNFYRNYNRYKSINLKEIQTMGLFDLLGDLEKNVLNIWKEPILNDLKCMIFYGLLKSLTVKWGIDPGGVIHNDLLVGEGDIKSKKVVTELLNIAEVIRNDKVMNGLFESNTPEDIYAKIMDNEEYSKLKKMIVSYLDEYGVRSIEEMKLESVPVKDNPAFCISILKNFVMTITKSGSQSNENELNIRKEAEKVVKEKLRFKRFLVVFSKGSIYRFVLKRTREGVRDRENQRFCRTEIYSIVRDVFLEIGRRWAESEAIDSQRDIFYLEWSEIEDFVKGRSTTPDLKSLIGIRKKLYGEFNKTNPDDRIETEGEPYIFLKNYKYGKTLNSGVMKGTPCSPGVVRGRVRVVEKPDMNLSLNGEILVARQTDPGWVVLFPSISGLIVERGSPLSHSAIVAREMGIPAIVGVKGVSTCLKDGNEVMLDGNRGIVELI